MFLFPVYVWLYCLNLTCTREIRALRDGFRHLLGFPLEGLCVRLQFPVLDNKQKEAGSQLFLVHQRSPDLKRGSRLRSLSVSSSEHGEVPRRAPPRIPPAPTAPKPCRCGRPGPPVLRLPLQRIAPAAASRLPVVEALARRRAGSRSWWEAPLLPRARAGSSWTAIPAGPRTVRTAGGRRRSERIARWAVRSLRQGCGRREPKPFDGQL